MPAEQPAGQPAGTPAGKPGENSLMVVLDREEYCFLYDRASLPEVLESLLERNGDPETTPPGFLNRDEAREIARGVIGRAYRQI